MKPPTTFGEAPGPWIATAKAVSYSADGHAAFAAAIEATPPTGSQAATRPDGKAGYLGTLPHSVIEGHARPGGDTPEAFKIAPAACVGARNRV